MNTEDIKTNIDQIEAEIKVRYKEVQDFRVSAQKTDAFIKWKGVKDKELSTLKRKLKKS